MMTKILCPACNKNAGEQHDDVLIYHHHGHIITISVMELVRRAYGSDVATALQTILAIKESFKKVDDC